MPWLILSEGSWPTIFGLARGKGQGDAQSTRELLPEIGAGVSQSPQSHSGGQTK